MSEDTSNNSAETQEVDKQNPQAQEATSTTQEVTERQFPSEEIKREFEELRRENRNLRTRYKELDATHNELRTFKEQVEAEKLSDTEKQTLAQKKLEQQLAEYQAQNNELLKRLQETRISNEVFRHAITQGIDAKAAAKLLDYSEVVTDDDGTPTNIPELLKKLQKEYPTLLSRQTTQQSSASATNPPRSQTQGPQQLTKEYVSRLAQNPAEFNALTPERQREVQAFIAKFTRFR